MAEAEGQNSTPPPSEATWAVYRIDDNGNQFVVRRRLTADEAKRLVAEFEARGHRQVYWTEQERK